MINTDETLPVALKCILLKISRSSLYCSPKSAGPGSEELELRRLLDELHVKYPWMKCIFKTLKEYCSMQNTRTLAPKTAKKLSKGRAPFLVV